MAHDASLAEAARKRGWVGHRFEVVELAESQDSPAALPPKGGAPSLRRERADPPSAMPWRLMYEDVGCVWLRGQDLTAVEPGFQFWVPRRIIAGVDTFPFMHLDFSTMSTPSLMVAADQDIAAVDT